MAGELTNPGKILPIEFGDRTGFVWTRDFDQGIASSLGAVPDPTGDNKLILRYPQFPEERDRNATVIFKTAEPTLQWHVFPRIVISRDSWVLALERYMPCTQEYMIPAPGSRVLSIPGKLPTDPPLTGPSAREAKIQAWPYDLTYTIECWHRYAGWALTMLFKVMKTFPPYGMMKLLDSQKEERSYDIFFEGGPTDLTEALSMTDRGGGFSYTFRVTGELDLDDPELMTTVQHVHTTLARLDDPTNKF